MNDSERERRTKKQSGRNRRTLIAYLDQKSLFVTSVCVLEFSVNITFLADFDITVGLEA